MKSRYKIGAISAVLMMVLMSFAASGTSRAGPNLNAQLQEETGPIDLLGGGNHVFIRFGTDAAFGVLWGTQENPNTIYVVVIKARYLGLAEVYDRSGKQVAKDRPIKIYSLYALKLEDLFEFDDVNGDGIINYRRAWDGQNFGAYTGLEPLFKKVDMTTAWERSEIERTGDENERNWQFSLTARDLPYVLINDSASASVGDSVLNELTFTFHLTASLVQINNATVRQWRITVTRFGGHLMFYDIARMEDRTVSGKVLAYRVKFDQKILGWDFDPENGNSRLLLEFDSIVGNYIPKYTAEWICGRMLFRMRENGTAHFEDDSGMRYADDKTGPFTPPRRLRSPFLEFGGNWTRIARFTWVTNVTVDGVEGRLYAQIQAGWPIVVFGRDGAVFGGFIILGGLSYPGGYEITHDPAVEGDALLDISTSSAGPISSLRGLVLLAMIASGVVIAVIAAIAFSHKRKESFGESFDRVAEEKEEDWTEYYSRK